MRFLVKGALCAAAIVAGLAAAPQAQARQWRTSGAWTTPRGPYAGHAEVVTRPGFRSRHAVITGPNGDERTISDERSWSMSEGTYSRHRTVRFADGASRTLEAHAQRVAPGRWTYSRTITDRNGRTRTVEGTIVTDERR